MPTNTVRAVLEAYAVPGVLGLARRDGNGTSSCRGTAPTACSASAAVTSSAASAPREPDPQRPEHPGRNALREELVERGELVPVEVEGVRGKRFVIKEDVELLEAPPEPPPSVAFLPPFDPLVWDRGLLGSLFDFDYVWELFLPPAKRRWGWYVLPIVFRDRFVGRIEPRIDRAEARVHVLDVWWENGFAPRRAEGFVDSMRDALRAYLRFAGASRLEWAPHLGTEKRLFLTRP